MVLPTIKDRYTYADVLAWDESVRVELIDGKAYPMISPSPLHQRIVAEISRQLGNFLEGKKSEFLYAPLDVRLFEKDGDSPKNVDTVVQPDIMVFCDKSKLDDHGCKGAPDMLIEVVSPSTLRHDSFVKLNLYQRAGVREYWIVEPENKAVLVYLLEYPPDGGDGFFRIHEYYEKNDIAKVHALDGCFIELCKVFPE